MHFVVYFPLALWTVTGRDGPCSHHDGELLKAAHDYALCQFVTWKHGVGSKDLKYQDFGS